MSSGKTSEFIGNILKQKIEGFSKHQSENTILNCQISIKQGSRASAFLGIFWERERYEFSQNNNISREPHDKRELAFR
jgi:hypothetical protein